jgi:pimeloyl-ACP methyl ester carboxylesterase
MHASHRGPRRLAAAAGAVLSALVLAGPAGAAQGGLELEWADCGEAGAQCATATVPKDYDNPGRGTLDLQVARSPATDPEHRIGSLFFNFGGPGAFAAPFVEAFGAEVFPVLNERFDIIGLDPRGTGLADGLDCMVNQETEGVYSKPFVTPDSLDVNALLRKDTRYIGRCIARNDNLQYLSTANVARDFNAVREAVGDKKMTYLGFSYGTFLGATIQSLFPGRTRAVVLDGALDADQYINEPLDSLDEQTAGFERAISRFMISCAAHQDLCPFGGGDVRGTLDDLIEQADATPIPASNAPDRPVTGDDIRAAVSQEVYSIYAWDELRDALVQLERGDGAGIRTIADGFWGRNPDGTYDPLADRYFLLSADEQNYPRRIEPYLRAGKTSYQNYDYAFWNHGYLELNWGLYPIRARDKFDGPFRTSQRDPTTLVVGTRYDPATPYKGAKRLVRQLGNARLLTMTGDGHTAYDGYPADGFNSACTDKAVEAYLFDVALPAEGTKCAQDWPDFSTPAPAATTQTTAAKALRSSKAAARKLVIAPGTRPLRLP